MRVRVASAGTGKTTSLVVRVLGLVDEGVPLRRIAAVTFTRTAAAELRQRVGEGVGTLLREGRYLDGLVRLAPARRARFEEAERELGGATITTIHGFLMGALRLVAPAVGLDPDAATIGEGEARAMFDDSVRSRRFVAQDDRHPSAARWARLGSNAATQLAELFAQRSLAIDLVPADDAAADLWAAYVDAHQRWTSRLGVARIAPAEIERLALRVAEAPTLAARVVARSPVLLVDEYQDVNPLQGRVFEVLERAGARVEVVGDPKQAIYGFRHADVDVFRRAAAAAGEAGTLDPPLAETRRHAPAISGLLNLLTGRLAADGLGFSAAEAPDVRTVGSQAQVEGRVELHWWRDDDADVRALRVAEFAWLGPRLAQLAREGHRWTDMAVLARTHATLAQCEAALSAAGVPAVLRQGRGYHGRPELRDLWHAIRVALDPRGLSLAAWLRGPFGGLGADAAVAIARSRDPEQSLGAHAPGVATRLAAVAAALAADPSNALATLAYGPWIDGHPYVAFLSARARDNVDACVVALAEQPPADLERLLDAFDRLARASDAGDVPQSGDGVTLLTVHAAKGLEWPVVAVVDTGRAPFDRPPAVAIDPADGRMARVGSPAHADLDRARRQRASGEDWRALYVALSRPREVLLVSGSQGRNGPAPWLRAFHLVGLGPPPGPAEEGSAVARALGVTLVRHPAPGRVEASAGPPASRRPVAEAAVWAGRVPRPAPFPAVVSPSWVALEGAGRAAEPLVRARWPASLNAPDGDGDDGAGPPPDPEEGERVAGRGTAVGTLVHDAIARGRRIAAEADLAELAVQEVLFPFPPAVRATILVEVRGLVDAFWAMVDDGSLAAPGAPDLDAFELPFAFEAGGSVWQGRIDRLARRGERWWLDDYKTDHRLEPERYAFPLATYVEAVARVHAVRPEARLIDLRHRRIVVVADDLLRASWQDRGLGQATNVVDALA